MGNFSLPRVVQKVFLVAMEKTRQINTPLTPLKRGIKKSPPGRS
jgi:hypothetical protein